jgi:hypothetical protein
MTRKQHPLPGNRMMITSDAELEADYLSENGEPRVPAEQRPSPRYTHDLDEATTVTSQLADTGLHRPVLDIDLPAQLIPSTTPGHYHLYLDVALPWRQYRELLETLAHCGIIQPGYASASIERGYTRVRLPWVAKQVKPEGRPAPEQARFGVLDGAL